MTSNREQPKLEIAYPCRWSYKVLGANEADLRRAIAETIQGREHTISLSNTSATGRYLSLNLELTVESEAERVAIYRSLSTHPFVKMVL